MKYLFLILGLAFLAVGGSELVGLVSGLAARAPAIETHFSLVVWICLGLFLLALAGLSFAPLGNDTVSDGLEKGVVVALIGGAVVIAVAAFAWDPVVGGVMRSHGYRVCRVEHGMKSSTVFWSPADRACASPLV